MRFDYTDAEYNVANSSMLAVIILTFICLAVQVRKKAPSHPPPLPPALLSPTALVQAFGFFGGFTMFDVALALLRESPPSHSSSRRRL